MTWVRLDDSVLSHPKVCRAGVEAFALWVGGLCYANRHATDGHLPEHVLSILYPASGWSPATLARLSRRLVEVGLWRSDERGGWMIHGYDEYQEEALRASVDARRAAARERKRAQRGREKQRFSEGIPPGHAVTARDSERDMPRDSERDRARDVSRDQRVTDASDEAEVREVVSQPPVPARPDPARPTRSSSADRARAGEALSSDAEAVRSALADAVRVHRQTTPPRDLAVGTGPSASVLDVARWCREEALRTSRSVSEVAREVGGRWARSRDRQGRWVPLGWLARDPSEWATAPASEVSVPETEAERDADVDELMRRAAWVPGRSTEVA